MTPAPWFATTMNDQTLITTARGKYVALLITKLIDRWTMDPGDLRLINKGAELFEAFKQDTAILTRMQTRFPQEIALDVYIQRNARLVASIEIGEEPQS